MIGKAYILRSAVLCSKEWLSFSGLSPTKAPIRYSRTMPAFKIYSLRRRIAEFLSNKFDEERVKEIGPDLACLEWLMECGSTEVLMSDDQRITSIRQMKKYIKERLEEKSSFSSSLDTVATELEYDLKWKHVPHVHIVRVDASDSAIADEGFKYFHDLKRLEALKLNFCDYFGDEAMRELAMGRSATTLRDIEIVLNPSISDGAVYWISRLKALQRAHFYFLPYVSNRLSFIRQLKVAVPRCHVTFPETVQIGYGYEDEKNKKKFIENSERVLSVSAALTKVYKRMDTSFKNKNCSAKREVFLLEERYLSGCLLYRSSYYGPIT